MPKFILSALMSLIVSSSLMASTAEGINWWGLGSEYADRPALGFFLITFFIFVGIVYKYAKSPIMGALKTRRESIKSAIQGASESKKVALDKFSALEKRLEALPTEIKSLQDSYRKRGELEEKALLAAALKLGEDLKRQTKAQIRNAERSAKRVIREELMALVEQGVLGSLQGAYSSDLDKVYMAQFVAEVQTISP